MHDRFHPARLLQATLVLITLVARPALAQEVSTAAGESTAQRGESDVPCASLSEDVRRRTERCKTDEEQRADDQARRRREALDDEENKRSSFLRWLHTDGLWVQSNTGNTMYGIVGVHLAVANVGRLHIYGPPGVMLVSEETSTGYVWRTRFTWGVSFRLSDFRPPGMKRQAQLYVNLAKVWSGGNYMTGSDMVGLSVTWKK